MLGTLALIDDGETDWKVLAIDVTDPLAKSLNDIGDVEKLMPGEADILNAPHLFVVVNVVSKFINLLFCSFLDSF